ncbi:hypothetical protein Q9L58_009411 [Maublancomyces gigas]|uniref:Uncharacterized protein n=1 Tax=Discina gigas TaxID=1032678 RepID=A0ABR3G6Z9_9PEZI
MSNYLLFRFCIRKARIYYFLHGAEMNGAKDIYSPEMLAKFPDTNIHIQDTQGRTAQHGVSAMRLKLLVQPCPPAPECDDDLRDNDGLKAFDLTPKDGIALFNPVQQHNVRLVKALIDRGVELTARKERGDTALHVATYMVEITALLA